jgi:hypothetical protein
MLVHILQVVEKGSVEGIIPLVSNDLDLIRLHFRDHVISKGFRPPNAFESFDSYFNAFMVWEDSDHCPYDKSDWHIILWFDVHLMEGPF